MAAAITPPPTNSTLPGCSRSFNTSSEVTITSAPSMGSGRGREPVAMTICFASRVRLPTLTAFGPTKLALSRKRSTPRSSSVSARDSGMPLIISFSRSISAAQSSFGLLTLMWWTWAWPISCSAWPAATSTFFGVQPRLGHVPPRSRSSTIATVIPAFRVGTVTPKPALPPPRISTS